MKKRSTIVFVLVGLLAVVCAACGGSETAPAQEQEAPVIVLSTAEPTQADGAPVVTAQPRDTETVDTSNQEMEYVSEEHRVAAGLAGQSVEELYAAIGEPENSEYGASCNADGVQDGNLYYDGFVVSTTCYADGSERVTGTWY